MTMPARSPRSNKRIVLLLLLTIAGWIAILFTESSQPPAEIMSLVPGLDKLAHFLAFGVLGLLICALWFKLKPKPAIPLFSMPLLLVSLSGLIEESYQMLVPGRTGSLPDLLADVGGAVFAIFLANRIAVLSRACSRFLP